MRAPICVQSMPVNEGLQEYPLELDFGHFVIS